ncbi:MAG: zf-TFIIB domain-containing protein [Planctomycetota bacterium]
MRLVMCKACHRQYDARHLEEGEILRCLCGEGVPVVEPPPHSPRAVRCSSCGAGLEADASSCGYCYSGVTIEERHLASVCPGCGARMSDRAHFCMECGLEIRPQVLIALPHDSPCPRCESEMRVRLLDEEISIGECTSCAGIWLSPDVFKNAVHRARSRHVDPIASHPEGEVALAKHAFRYLACPICRDRMTPRNFATTSGIMIDVCREHGIWFDHGEYQAVLRFAQDRNAAGDAPAAPAKLDYGRDLPPTRHPGRRSAAVPASALTIEFLGELLLGFFDLD